jgi:flagellar biogenesis protein FliO
MQFYKKTRSTNFNFLSLFVKLLIIAAIIITAVFLLNKVNFPAPNKAIEKIIPNENIKVVK